MTIKLHWKLTAVFCAAILLALLVGFFYLSVHFKSYFNAHLESTLKHELALGKAFVDAYPGSLNNLSEADAIADLIGNNLGIRATIIALDGKVLGDSQLTLDEVRAVENHANRPEIVSALAKGFGSSRRYSYTLRKYLIYGAVALDKKSSGVLRLAIPVSELERFESRFIKVILVSLVIVFLLSAAFTFLIAVYVSRPLRAMADVARAVAKGDFSRKPLLNSPDELGDLAHAMSYMSDEIKIMMERIRKEGTKFDAVLTGMSEGVMVLSEKGEIILMNPSLKKILFVDSPPEGKKIEELIRNTAVLDMAHQLISGKKSIVSQEVVMSSLEGNVFQVNAAALKRDDRLEGAVFVFHDITELRRLEKVRQDFVANVSHELRTPVASIKGYAETLLQGALVDPCDAKEFVGIIQRNSHQLISLINDLLDLAKIESGKMKMVFLPLVLKPVVQRCLGVLDEMLAKKSLKVVLDFPEGLPKLNADEKRLSQVLLNLLDNAVKYTPDHGEINVRVRAEGGFVRIDIEDTGIGIPEKDILRIFERFYRVDRARSQELGGTGLGLSIVKHIVHAHGGDVFVVSTVGRGSVFSITIPAV